MTYASLVKRSKYRRARPAGKPARQPGRRLALLAERNFRVFYVGYVTSLLGSAMSRIALTFAVLGDGGSAADLGFVFAASVVPTVVFMLGGGVLADRLGRRQRSAQRVAIRGERRRPRAGRPAYRGDRAGDCYLHRRRHVRRECYRPFPAAGPQAGPAAHTAWRDLADGWTQFRAQTWLWITTIQFALFNLFSWAPYLLLGPILARAYLGGARAWGVIVGAFAVGAILAGALVAGRRPHRPLVVAVLGSFGYGAPCLALALHAPLAAVAAAAALAGAGSTTFSTYFSTVMQQRVPPDLLARTTAFALTGAYALGALGYAVIGPLADVVGAGRLLGLAAGYATLSSATVLMVPAIRSVTWREPPDWGARPEPAREGGSG